VLHHKICIVFRRFAPFAITFSKASFLTRLTLPFMLPSLMILLIVRPPHLLNSIISHIFQMSFHSISMVYQVGTHSFTVASSKHGTNLGFNFIPNFVHATLCQASKFRCIRRLRRTLLETAIWFSFNLQVITCSPVSSQVVVNLTY
jgi:hypothetical protein